MDGLTPGGKSQPTPPPQQDNAQRANQVSERQASDFADRMAKEKRSKEKAAEDKANQEKKATGKLKTNSDPAKEQSLESLMAERSKKTKEPVNDPIKDPSRDALKDHFKDHLKDDRAKDKDQFSDNMADRLEQNVLQKNTGDVQIKTDAQLREIQQANSVKDIDAIVSKLADQIQVSAKDAINGAEVRISMKDGVLPGTEIRIQRQAGELVVTMNSTSAEAVNFLAQHEANLQKILADRFSNDRVEVNINFSGGDNQDTDGRSRNEYVTENNDQNPTPGNRQV